MHLWKGTQIRDDQSFLRAFLILKVYSHHLHSVKYDTETLKRIRQNDFSVSKSFFLWSGNTWSAAVPALYSAAGLRKKWRPDRP